MNKLIIPFSFLFLVACGKSFQATQLDQELQKPIVANQTAKDYADWESSKNNPEQLFAMLIKKYMAKEITSELICERFDLLSDIDLSLYENQLRKEETSFIFKECKTKLIKKLDDYWNNERKKLKIPIKKTSEDIVETEPAPIIHRFAQVVEAERDVSQGYMAVRGDLLDKQVALTFDDGPHGEFTQEIIEALEAANVKATFFVKGQSVKRNPEVLKALAKAGHAIGTHSNSHRCLGNRTVCGENNKINGVPKILSFEEASEDIFSGHQAVIDVLGWVYPFFRFPFGETSPDLKSLLKKSGTGEFYWSVDSDDWRNYKADKTPYTTEDMVEKVMTEVKKANKGLVLNHDIQKKTAVGLPALLNRLYEEGFQPVVFVPADKNSIQESGLLKEAKVLREARALMDASSL